MAKKIIHEKGFKVIEMSPEEAKSLGFGMPEGCVCMQCNNIIKDTLYYIAVLNDVMDKQCYDEFLDRAIYYKEDSKIENKYFDYYCKLLNI